MNEYTFYWLDGKKEVLKGESVAGAFMNAGYGAGAMSALDFTCNGKNEDYNFIGGKWVKSYKMYFNTGVRPENRLSLSGENKGKLVLSDHEILKGGVIQVVYYLEEKPKDNYRLLYLSPEDYLEKMPEYEKAIKIIAGGMLSDYAIFLETK